MDSSKHQIHVQVVEPSLVQPVDALRADFIGRYIGLRGNVVRATGVMPLVTELSFTCSRCGCEFTKPAEEGRFEFPGGCPSKCKFAKHNLNRDKCKAVDWQRIRLQEDFGELPAGAGTPRRMPRTVDCNLKEHLVGTCVPGDVVTFYGIVRAMPTAGGIGKGGEGRQGPSKAVYVLYLEVKALVNTRRLEGAAGQDDEFSELQLSFVREIHRAVELGDERFPLIAASFCPQIFGQSLVKAALLLSLLGGLPVYAPGIEKRLCGAAMCMFFFLVILDWARANFCVRCPG